MTRHQYLPAELLGDLIDQDRAEQAELDQHLVDAEAVLHALSIGAA